MLLELYETEICYSHVVYCSPLRPVEWAGDPVEAHRRSAVVEVVAWSRVTDKGCSALLYFPELGVDAGVCQRGLHALRRDHQPCEWLGSGLHWFHISHGSNDRESRVLD